MDRNPPAPTFVPVPTPFFTDAQKDRILHFLGYPHWTALAQSIQLGYPMASQPLFLVYDAFVRLAPGGATNALRDLCQLEAIECQMADARTRFKASAVGTIKMNAGESRMLRDELEYWTKRLEDDMGIQRNPYSQMAYRGMGGGVNGKVIG